MQRRNFMQAIAGAGTAAACFNGTSRQLWAEDKHTPKIAFGLVTYMWAAQWDLPTLIANCQKCNVLGVELRTTHKHGVEPSLTEKQRADVRKRFADSEVTLVGLGSN